MTPADYRSKPRSLPGWLLAVCMTLTVPAGAHDYTNLNEYQIDRANDAIAQSVLQIQLYLTDLFRLRQTPETWPDPKLGFLRADLMHQKEEAAMGIEYFLAAGVNIQSPEVLLEKPLAGRSMAASLAVETAYSMLRYVETFESQDAFRKEIYAKGQAAFMYELISAQREKMAIFQELFRVMPGPPGLTVLEDGTVIDNREALPEATSLTPAFSYALAILGCCALLAMFLGGRRREQLSSAVHETGTAH